jgi:diguanylate cyclase (GGDEF)-like protein
VSVDLPHRRVPGPLPSGLASVIDWLPVATLVADERGRVAAVNRAWRELTGRTGPESAGDRWLAVLDRADGRRFLELLDDLAASGGVASAEYQLCLGPGRRWTRWTAHYRYPDEQPLVLVAVADIDEDRARHDHLRYQATHDSLTGLVNRAHFLELAGQALDRHGEGVVVVFVDLDGFKAVNDRGGDLLGDQILAAAAERLRGAVRPGDVVARVGGDEFAVLYEDPGETNDTEIIVGQLNAALVAPIEVFGKLWPISAAVGVAAASAPVKGPEELLGNADRAMRAARAGAGHSRGVTTFKTGDGARSLASAHDGAGITTEVANTVIQEIFAVGLTLASFASTVKGPTAERLVVAVDHLDAIISRVRRAAFGEFVTSGDTPAALTDAPAGETTMDEIIDLLSALARRLTDLSGAISADSEGMIPLLDAGHSLYRSIMSLTAEPIGASTDPHSRATHGPTPWNARSEGHMANPHRPATSPPNRPQGADMPTKQTTKAKPVKVTFTLPAEIDADQIVLCGEFNGWSPDTELTRSGDGSWHTTISLTSGVYRYRYLLDGTRWENAWDADDYVPNPYGGDDSVIVVTD